MTTNNNNSINGGGNVVDNDKDNPFAEYMWMHEEDEYNKEALEQIREEDFIEQCFEEMLDEEEMGMFMPPPHLHHFQQHQDVDAGVELMNNLNLGVQENIIQQDIEEELSSSDHGDDDEGVNDGGDANGSHSNQGNEDGNQGDKDAEDNSEGSTSDVDSDASSDAPLR